MFLGVDHGTTAIRFATTKGDCWELSRQEAGNLSSAEILCMLKDRLGVTHMDLIALTYSMGDGLTRITRLEDTINRGLLQQDGAGVHVGGGTRVFEAIRASGWPCVLLPGIHRSSDVDSRLKVFSHGMSPEKVGLAYEVYCMGFQSFIISDASSNTVTFAVLKGRIVGAIDAPIFAPGLLQGPLDVEAIRNVDAGRMTANEAFTRSGILRRWGRSSLEDCSSLEKESALEALALFSAMEISALAVLMRDLGEEEPGLFLAGSPAGMISGRVSKLLCKEVKTLEMCSAAKGCARIAKDVFSGEMQILGLEVDAAVHRSLSGSN